MYSSCRSCYLKRVLSSCHFVATCWSSSERELWWVSLHDRLKIILSTRVLWTQWTAGLWSRSRSRSTPESGFWPGVRDSFIQPSITRFRLVYSSCQSCYLKRVLSSCHVVAACWSSSERELWWVSLHDCLTRRYNAISSLTSRRPPAIPVSIISCLCYQCKLKSVSLANDDRDKEEGILLVHYCAPFIRRIWNFSQVVLKYRYTISLQWYGHQLTK